MILPTVLVALALFALRVFVADVARAGLPEPYGALAIETVGLLLALAIAFVVDRCIRKFYWRGYFQGRRGHDAPELMQDLVTVLLLAISVSVWLYFELDIPLSGVLAASGVTALIVGFALQTMILDLFSGLSINLDGAYGIGDWLTLNAADFPEPLYGRVEGLTWRSTIIRLENGNCLIVPNRFTTLNPVTNHSRPKGPKRNSVEVVLDLKTPAERAMRLLLGEAFKASQLNGMTANPAPSIILRKLDQSAAFFEVRFYSYPDKISPNEAKSIMLRALHDAIRLQGLPTPTHQVEISRTGPLPPPIARITVREAISRVALFAEVLDAAQLDDLAERCSSINFPSGAELVRQGDPGGSMFIILEGAARVSLAGIHSSEEGLSVLAAGDIVGEMSLMTGAPRSASVVALTPVSALEITKSNIEDLLAKSAELLQKFGRVLAERQTQLEALNQRQQPLATVERDMVKRMRAFFSRSFHA